MKRKYKGKCITHPQTHYIVLDIETTGFNYPSANIIEICAKKYDNHQYIDTFKTLIKPNGTINDFITNLTGITNAMVHIAPYPHEVLPDFLIFIEDTPLIAHNANFDINFLYDTCIDVLGTPITNDFIDTLELARRFVKDSKNHKLETLAQHFNLDTPNHRAEQDVDVTQALYLILSSHP